MKPFASDVALSESVKYERGNFLESEEIVQENSFR